MKKQVCKSCNTVFNDKPYIDACHEIRTKLKSNGFRWSPSEGAWQRQRSNGAKYAIEQIVKELN